MAMTTKEREPYLDFLRAVSLIVVVLWHWAFTILHWTPTGPQPTNPLAYFRGLWVLTWFLQVLPVFFYVGGSVHLASWQRARAGGQSRGSYVWHHVKELATPAGVLILFWAALGVVLTQTLGARWVGGAVLLVLSPLWFLAVYVGLLLLLPVMAWLHERFDVLVLVWLGGVALLVDVLRLRFGWSEVSWVNVAAVWGLAYQAGFFHHRIVAASRHVAGALLWAGSFALAGLVLSGLYPGSMVGVPGERMSNMSPPTFVIVALLAFQAGLCEVLRPAVERALAKPRWQRATAVFTRYALPLFLFHTTGMALARAVVYFGFDRQLADDRAPDWIWWAERPLAILGPLVFSVPLIVFFGRWQAVHRANNPGTSR